MNNLNSDLILLENLSKKISDLIFDKNFSQVLEIDAQRKLLIRKIKENQTHKSIIKKRIGKLVENNNGLVEDVEKKIRKLSKNHSKFDFYYQKITVNLI